MINAGGRLSGGIVPLNRYHNMVVERQVYLVVIGRTSYIHFMIFLVILFVPFVNSVYS